MNIHPEFLDSMKQFVAQQVDEWERENPQPIPSQENKPAATIPMTCTIDKSQIVLAREGQICHFFVTTSETRIKLYLQEGQLNQLIENLLELQCDVISYREWQQGGDEGIEWTKDKSRFMLDIRQKFVAQYEHRYSETQKSEENVEV